MQDTFHLIWLTGASCDGCTIKALGDRHAGGIEALLSGGIAGLPRVVLVHPVLSVESGDAFLDLLRTARAGGLRPFGIVNESAITSDAAAAPGFFATLGIDAGAPVPVGEWLTCLAPSAAFVVAWGDCAVWGGPHSLEPNPTGSTGTGMHLGLNYRSALNIPVINLPGCAPPTILLKTLEQLLRCASGAGTAPALDELNRPRDAYGVSWPGAFAAWQS